jgi:hypothetical protein
VRGNVAMTHRRWRWRCRWRARRRPGFPGGCFLRLLAALLGDGDGRYERNDR